MLNQCNSGRFLIGENEVKIEGGVINASTTKRVFEHAAANFDIRDILFSSDKAAAEKAEGT
jgi:hypothetical protein